MNQPSVAIVILNWNGRHYLQQFLPFVLKTDYPNFFVVVADNASTDDSIAFLQEHYPDVRQIHLSKNYGFAEGYNEALKQVQADYYVLLNSDVEVTPGWLLPLVACLQKNPAAGACQPKIRAYHNRSLFEHAGAAGGWIDAFGYPFARGRLFEVCEKDEGQYDDVQPVFGLQELRFVFAAACFTSSMDLMLTFLHTWKRLTYAGACSWAVAVYTFARRQ